ncbi:ImmA/IrrE family metallo-endopeptidase [Acidaminobacter sp.]|uniref:ImmA/IrrE family metallo-endopeptidase n=1 Tax=Acidaminobacter sp. TaxID=1872102 RepID=UPI002560AFDD|nr:ImmA/IrrE family metallo-endopeptidase [Acidaminobacter sp.]MDK9711209.1 ImmA/IrrE family metallo-endopeptidase [Acidaminobacter sp.]
MLELITSYTFSHVPYIEYSALDEYATDVIRDYKRTLLLKPEALDIEDFLEFYLGLQIEYKRLSYDQKVLGLTAFNPGYVQIIDEQTGHTEPLSVETGTVIVENSLTTKRNLPRFRFTLGHEGSHWLLHRKVFSAENQFFSNEKYENQYLAAKEGRIDYSRKQNDRTDSDRIERQADFLSSALLMPKDTLRMTFKEFFKYYDDKPRRIIRGKSPLDDRYASLLPKYVSKVFQVSERAALIRLEKLTGIVDYKTWGNRA